MSWRRMGLAVACLLALGLAGCPQDRQASAEAVLRVGLAQMPMSADPRYATDAASMRIQRFLHRGLIRMDRHFRPQPDLAESWSHPDPLLWRLHLRDGIRFHDGRNVTAMDAVATLNAILDPAMASPLRGGFSAIREVRAVDEHTLEIRLKSPDASLLTRLTIGILPKDQARGPQRAHRITGCGAFRLSAWRDGRVELVRVEPAPPGRAARLRFETVKDPVTRILKISRGELDFIQNDLPPHLLGYLHRQKQLKLQTIPSTTFSYIGLNLQDPALSDLRVRRALALALDRVRLKRALFADLPVLAETILTPGHWATTDLPGTPYDPAQAVRLLDAAGFPPDKDGVRLRLSYRTSTDPTRLRLATAIASMWGRIGIRVEVQSMEWGGFYARIRRGDFQVYSLSWVGITDPDIYRWVLHSSMWPPKGANRGRYADADMDRWLDQAAASEDTRLRRSLYAKIQRRMQRDMVYIPLWFEPVVAVSGPRLSGFEPRPDGDLLGLADARFAPEAR